MHKERQPETQAWEKDKKRGNLSRQNSWTRWRIPYEPLHWAIFFGAVTVAIADRFVWNAWPRDVFRVGSGSAGSDFVDGIKPGPWSVAVYDIVARVSGRYSILCLNDLFFTTMHSFFRSVKETWVARHVVDFSNSDDANRRIHRVNGTGLAVLTLVHVYSIFAPVVFHGYSAQVNVGDFEWPLSERGHSDFSDVNPDTKTVMLQADDVWRLVEMTLLLGIVLPLSVVWLSSKWHLGTWVHNFVSFAYFVDIVRRHTHPHSWVLNLPMFGLWILDNAVGVWWRRHAVGRSVRVLRLSANYVVLFWHCPRPHSCTSSSLSPWSKSSPSRLPVAPLFFVRKKKDAGCLERAHPLTCFFANPRQEGWEGQLKQQQQQQQQQQEGSRPQGGGGGGVGGSATSRFLEVGALVRVYHRRREPALCAKDAWPHMGRAAADASDVVAHGPFFSDKSEKLLSWLQKPGAEVAVVAGGSGGAVLLDALAFFLFAKERGGAGCCHLTCLFSTNDGALFKWVKDQVNTLLTASSSSSSSTHRRCRTSEELKSGEPTPRGCEGSDEQGGGGGGEKEGSMNPVVKLACTAVGPLPCASRIGEARDAAAGLSVQAGRLTFDEIAPKSQVFAVGGAGLLGALRGAVASRKASVVSGVCYDGSERPTSSTPSEGEYGEV